MDRGAWWATVHGVAKSRIWQQLTHTHTTLDIIFISDKDVRKPGVGALLRKVRGEGSTDPADKTGGVISGLALFLASPLSSVNFPYSFLNTSLHCALICSSVCSFSVEDYVKQVYLGWSVLLLFTSFLPGLKAFLTHRKRKENMGLALKTHSNWN